MMKSHFVPLILSLVTTLALLPGCGSDDIPDAENPGQSSPTGGPSPYARSTRASRLADEFSLSCQNGPCPKSTGALFLSTIMESGLCTAWVAGEYQGKTVVMTNKHCVEAVSDCSQNIAIRIADTAEAAQCERILRISEFKLEKANGNVDVVPDYAAILLDRKLKAQPIPLSQSGLPYESRISIRKAWRLTTRSIDMREESCTTGYNSILVPNYLDPLSPNVSLYTCQLKGGVSGSPVINENGQAAAIVQISSKENTPTLSIPGLESSEFKLSDFGAATNLTCVEVPELGLKRVANNCGSSTSDSAARTNLSDALTPLALAKLMGEDASRYIESETSGLFSWTFRPDDSHRVSISAKTKLLGTLEMVPKCVLLADDPDSHLKREYFTGNRWSGSKGWQTSGKVTATSPGWGIGLKIDRFGRILPTFTLGRKMATYTFNPAIIAELVPKHTVRIVEEVQGVPKDLILPACPMGLRSREIKENQEALDCIRRNDDKCLQQLIDRQAARDKSEL